MKVKIETTPEDLQAVRRAMDSAAMLLRGEPIEQMTQVDQVLRTAGTWTLDPAALLS